MTQTTFSIGAFCDYCFEVINFCDSCGESFSEYLLKTSDEIYCQDDKHFCCEECLGNYLKKGKV